MSEEFKPRFGTVIKNVLPAVVVMAVGVSGAYLVRANYLAGKTAGYAEAQATATQASGIEPAAGTPAAAPAEENKAVAVPALDTTAKPDPASTGTTIMKDEGEDSGETGSSTDNTMSSGSTTPPTPAPDAGTKGDTAPAPAPAQ